MFSKSANYYDDIYASIDKDYSVETKKLQKFIQKHKKSGGYKLLDVACGTGTHTNLLSQHYHVEGIDLDSKMLSVARKKYPVIKFHNGNMLDFSLNHKFDVIICLFSSIGYVRTKPNLVKAIQNMAGHLLPGGVLLVEPWFSSEQWSVGHTHMTVVNRDDLKIARMSRSSRRGNVSIIEFQYLIGRPKGIEHIIETHKLGLFSNKDHIDAFESAGLKTTHDTKGLDGRGLYIGTKSVE